VLTIALSKHGDTRHVPLNSAAIKAFRTLSEQPGRGNPVFISKRGDALRKPRYWFEQAIEDAEIEDFTWHCLRYTFASRLVMKGVDIRTVQELMGHKTIQMTVRYAHLAPQHKLAAVERLCDVQDVQKEPTDTRIDTGALEPFLEQAAITS
jgi:site-specific recombinase XerD